MRSAKSDGLSSLANTLPATAASFKYIRDSAAFQTEKPYFYQGPLEPSQEKFRTNIDFETYHVPVRDLRDIIPSLSLDLHGLQVLHRPSSFTSSLDTEEGLHNYLNETNDMIRRILQADIVICYDVKVRERAHKAMRDYTHRSSSSAKADWNPPKWSTMIRATWDRNRRLMIRPGKRILVRKSSFGVSDSLRLLSEV